MMKRSKKKRKARRSTDRDSVFPPRETTANEQAAAMIASRQPLAGVPGGAVEGVLERAKRSIAERLEGLADLDGPERYLVQEKIEEDSAILDQGMTTYDRLGNSSA